MTSPDPNYGIRPSLAELIALRARVVAWPPPQRAHGSASGLATSPARGRGMDYAESRLYAQGDDARHIDWRVTARTGVAHTKVFHAERDRVTWLIADTSPYLFFGTRRCFKSVLAAQVGALSAWAAQRSGDRISALRGSQSEAPLPPAGGSRGALRALDALNRWYQAPLLDDLGLDVALQAAGRVCKPGSRLVVLLDPRSIDNLSDARLTALSAHHDALAVLLVDPLELAPPRAQLAFAGPASRIELDLSDPQLRLAWMHAFAERFDAACMRLRRLGWRALAMRTDEPADQVLTALLPYRREAA